MFMQRILSFTLAFFCFSFSAQASNDHTSLAVWANEAIVATYTYNYKNYLARHKEIARYFTSKGWIAYSKALNDSKLPETVKKNDYFVSAVAAMPPTIKTLQKDTWVAVMPLLVVYKNPQYQQKQTLEVTIHFKRVSQGQGVRGLAITSLKSKVTEPPCRCS